MNDTQKKLIYLLSCAVNGITPDIERIQDTDLEKLYKYSQFHSVGAAVCIAIERAGIKHEKFHDTMKKSYKKKYIP